MPLITKHQTQNLLNDEENAKKQASYILTRNLANGEEA